jgi:hypothetical protein
MNQSPVQSQNKLHVPSPPSSPQATLRHQQPSAGPGFIEPHPDRAMAGSPVFAMLHLRRRHRLRNVELNLKVP